jgi:hypothetical protein
MACDLEEFLIQGRSLPSVEINAGYAVLKAPAEGASPQEPRNVTGVGSVVAGTLGGIDHEIREGNFAIPDAGRVVEWPTSDNVKDSIGGAPAANLLYAAQHTGRSGADRIRLN